MEKYDVIVVLGAQIVRAPNGSYEPAYHTKLRARAAAIAYRLGITQHFIVSGGRNFGVRYDLETNEVYQTPNFSFEAFAHSFSPLPSEAEVIYSEMKWTETRGFASLTTQVPRYAVLLETLSATTQENALFVKQILSRKKHPDVPGTNPADLKKIGLLTQLYHMPRALDEFEQAGLQVEPVYAEDLLAIDGMAHELAHYYSSAKGGKLWGYERIGEILVARARGDRTRSVHELVEE